MTEADVDFFLEADRVVDLVHVVVESKSEHDRDRAAAKLIELWHAGRKGGVTLHHLAYVGDYAGEPYSAQADDIIRNNL